MASKYCKLTIGAVGIPIIIDYALMKLNYKEKIKKFIVDNRQRIVFAAGSIAFAGLFCYGTYKILYEMVEGRVGETRIRILEEIREMRKGTIYLVDGIMDKLVNLKYEIRECK
jgi:hypothetical protein